MLLVLLVLLTMVLVLLVLLVLLVELHLDPSPTRRHRLDRRPLPVPEARSAVVSTCMQGGSSEALNVPVAEARSERCGEHMHARRVIRGTQRTGRRGALGALW